MSDAEGEETKLLTTEKALQGACQETTKKNMLDMLKYVQFMLIF